jgi:hypothetical protein
MFLKWRSISICGVVLFLTLIYFTGSTWIAGRHVGFEFSKTYPSKETLKSLFLTEDQCNAAFPGLTKEVDIAAAKGPFNLKKGPASVHGSVEGRIKDGKVGCPTSRPFLMTDVGVEAIHHLCGTR